MLKILGVISLLLSLCFLGACAKLGVPQGLTVINDFDSEKFLGTWYEIARLDHREERNLSEVRATYAKRSDGGISVLNQGYNTKKKKWVSIEGKAYQTGQSNEASLKVSFFGPFYGSYNVIKLDAEYQMAMLTSYDKKYFWILARDTNVDEAMLQSYIQQAKDWGFATDQLIRVQHGVQQK